MLSMRTSWLRLCRSVWFGEVWNYYATNTDLSYAQVAIRIRWAESDSLTPGLKLGTGITGGNAGMTEIGSSDTTMTVASSGSSRNGDGLSTDTRVGVGAGVGLLSLPAVGPVVFI